MRQETSHVDAHWHTRWGNCEILGSMDFKCGCPLMRDYSWDKDPISE